MNGEVVIVRGGGDIASGIIQKLHRVGFRVLVLESETPTAIRRMVSFAEAIYEGKKEIEGVTAIHTKNIIEIYSAWSKDFVPVLIDPQGNYIEKFKPIAVVDAILAKRNIGMRKDLAPITIAVGPGFTAGIDCNVVIESNRGHDLGKLIYQGETEQNTGIPGNVDGYTVERVLYAPDEGRVELIHKIGDVVKAGDIIGYVNDKSFNAKLEGVVRGLIRDGAYVQNNMKIGDVDPRLNKINNCYTISDKARAIGGAVLEALMIEMRNKDVRTVPFSH